MIDPAAPTWAVAIVPLAALALVLFAIAVRSGRWGVWLAGYATVILTLAIALAASPERATRAGDRPATDPPAAGQPSDGSGVLDLVDTRLAGDRGT